MALHHSTPIHGSRTTESTQNRPLYLVECGITPLFLRHLMDLRIAGSVLVLTNETMVFVDVALQATGRIHGVFVVS